MIKSLSIIKIKWDYLLNPTVGGFFLVGVLSDWDTILLVGGLLLRPPRLIGLELMVPNPFLLNPIGFFPFY